MGQKASRTPSFVANGIEIEHLGETAAFRLRVASFSVVDGLLNLELESTANSNGPFSHMPAPSLYIEDATVGSALSDRQRLDVKIGWDTDEDQKSDNIFRIYIGQHLALNDNVVEITRKDGALSVDWTCSCQNIIDFRHPDNRLRIQCVIPIPSAENAG